MTTFSQFLADSSSPLQAATEKGFAYRGTYYIHALQRTAPCVTAPASTAAFPPAMQVPRRTPRSVVSRLLASPGIDDCQIGFFPYFSAMSVQDIETAVTRLSQEELARFSQWFEEYVADQWDRQIEADILAGRFDAAGKRAKADYDAGRCTPL